MNITFEKITNVLKKNLAILVAVGLLCACGAFAAVKLFVPASYYTTAQFYIKDTKAYIDTSTDVSRTRLLADTFILILDTNHFFNSVHEALPADVAKRYTVGQLRAGSSFTSLNNTEIIRVTFDSYNEKDVVVVVNAILSCIQPHLESVYGDCKNNVVDYPMGVSVSSSRASTTSFTAAIVGVFVAFAIVFFRDVLDVHIRSAAALAERCSVPILGTVPEFENVKRKKEAAQNGKADK